MPIKALVPFEARAHPRLTFPPCTDHQHIIFMEVMGKYPPPLHHVLVDDTPGEPKRVLDLGCGSGSWSASVCPVSASVC